MKVILLTLLILPCSALADLTDQDIKIRKETAQKAATAADSDLPPCEGHLHLEEAVGRFAPPASCPKARQIFEYYLEASRKIRENCREMTHWVENELRDPAYCSSVAGRELALKKLSTLKQDISEEATEEPAEIAKLIEDPDSLEMKKSGEFVRKECQFPIVLGEQLRHRQRSLANKNYGMADNAINSVCEEGPSGADDYLKFLRDGEKAL